MATRDSELTFVEIGAWIGPELVGIGITILVIDEWNKRRARRELEAHLFRQIRSSVRDVAVAALDELADLGHLSADKNTFVGFELFDAQWARANLEGANLQKVDLRYANLQEARLGDAKLQGADLRGAELQKADLRYANVQGAADLRGAKLQGAILSDTELQEADLWYTNLQGAILSGANLAEADLLGANLAGAILAGANLEGAILLSTNQIRWDASFHEDTILPDGTNWTPDTNITRFTDPNHPDFWRPASGSVWWYPEDSDQGDG